MSVFAVHSSEQPAAPRMQADLQDARLKQACQQLEAVFWQQILQAARKTIGSRGGAQDLYTGLLDEQYALLLAGQNRSGLGRVLYEQLRTPAGEVVQPGE